MAGQHPSDVDVTLTDPAAIVHTVADFLAAVAFSWLFSMPQRRAE